MWGDAFACHSESPTSGNEPGITAPVDAAGSNLAVGVLAERGDVLGEGPLD